MLIFFILFLGDSESYINSNIDLDRKSIIKEEQENDEDCYKKAIAMSYKGELLRFDFIFYLTNY